MGDIVSSCSEATKFMQTASLCTTAATWSICLRQEEQEYSETATKRPNCDLKESEKVLCFKMRPLYLSKCEKLDCSRFSSRKK